MFSSLPPFALALCGLLAMLPASAAPPPPTVARPATGRIEGDVVISTALSTRRPRFRIYADPGPGARPPAPEGSEIRNVVLYLQNAPAADAPAEAKCSMPSDGGGGCPTTRPAFSRR